MRLVLWALGLALSPITLAVKPEDFKTCAQSSFCRRLKGIAKRYNDSPKSFTSPYFVSSPHHGDVEAFPDGRPFTLKLPISSTLYPEIKLELRVDVLEEGDGIVRLRMDELGSTTGWRRYNETARWALVDPEPRLSLDKSIKVTRGKTVVSYGPKESGLTLEIQHKPFKITQKRKGRAEMVINDRSLFHMEHFRKKEEKVEGDLGEAEQMVLAGDKADRAWFEEDDGEAFEEKFRQWTDSKPKALSVDITFPGVSHIYGLPEHASPLSLPDTVGPHAHYTDPYRLYNVDIFEYLSDSPMALYGAVPLLHAHSATHSVGVLNLVGSDTFVDVEHSSDSVRTHWMSESGILDILLLPGPRPKELFEQYAILTGPTPLPPAWSTGYHQCRWNYVDEADVMDVQRRFDEVDIPLDVTWLDIEYADEHRYFDWDAKHFPDPVKMQEAVAAKGRKMVAIVDPHIKKTDSFRIYNDAKELDILVKKPDGSNFEGWCWTGSSVWVDFFNPKSWDWWIKMFSFGVWKESTPSLFIWNDMNEPSVFDGPEISVPRDTVHHNGWENRDVHNINGMLFVRPPLPSTPGSSLKLTNKHNATTQALIARQSPPQRPFVLSRSFFAGSQRFSAIWTGDNMGTWEHFAGETAMLLSNNIAGMSFGGADVGGFFGNPSPELLVRWYQAGAFMPFFRAHAHIDTKRREPYLYPEPTRGQIRDAIRTRYRMLAVWYSAFHDASTGGWPIMRPQYVVFPEDEQGFAVDDQYYIGDEGVLVKPVTVEGATMTDVYIADEQPYYDYFTYTLYPAQPTPYNLTLPTPLSTHPVLLQGGHILPIRQRVRRSSPLMWQDPYTLIVALDVNSSAKGQLYSDDGTGYGYTSGEYIWKAFEYKHGRTGVLRCSPHDESKAVAGNAWETKVGHVQVEQVVILGLRSPPKAVRKVGGAEVEWSWEDGAAAAGRFVSGTASRLVLKKPGVGVAGDWEIVLDF